MSHQVADLRLRVVSGIVAAVDHARCAVERREDEGFDAEAVDLHA